jgi:LysM repeat protein
MIKVLSFMAAALLLAGCGRRDGDVAANRAGGLYKDAMADYTAGRLDAAIAGLEKVVRASPANASARFQLATLMQDRRRDYLTALSLYREYLMQSPSSDKASLAKERSSLCERQYALELMRRHGGTNEHVTAQLKELRAALAARDGEIAQLKASLASVTGECDIQTRENERLRRMVSSIGSGESTAKPKILTAKDLLDDDEEEHVVDRVKLSADIRALDEEEKTETVDSPLPVVEKKPAPPAESQAKKPALEKKPDTYIVVEGDTLYKIAIRFYGKRSAWQKIRDANKGSVSMDGRIRVGQTLRLP